MIYSITPHGTKKNEFDQVTEIFEYQSPFSQVSLSDWSTKNLLHRYLGDWGTNLR